MPKIEKTPFAMSPDLRQTLFKWPAGEARTQKYSYSIHWLKGHRGHARKLLQLEAAGYLKLATDKGPFVATKWNYEEITCTRTDKLVREYKPRTTEAKKRAYKGEGFPWSVAEHWKLMQNSAARSQTAVIELLTGDRTHKGRPGTTKLRLPQFVHTRTELDNYRRALLGVFAVPVKNPRRVYTEWFPQGFVPLLSSGHQIRMLLLDMLVEPTFDAKRVCIGFRPLDSKQAAEELERLAGGDNAVDKYFSHTTNGIENSGTGTS